MRNKNNHRSVQKVNQRPVNQIVNKTFISFTICLLLFIKLGEKLKVIADTYEVVKKFSEG
jgi:hypothetical protein